MNRALLIGLLVTIGACSATPPLGAPGTVSGAGGVLLQPGWRSTVLVERTDSIVLTLPSGDRQLQYSRRTTGLTVTIGSHGEVGVHVDSTRSVPADGVAAPDLSGLARVLLPRLPEAGARPNATWRDSATETVPADIFKFKVTERRTATWSTGAITDHTMPVRVSEDFEQLGNGLQDARRVSITANGRRTGSYYARDDGRILRATLRDSSAMSIGIPDAKQVLSGTRLTRTEIRFIPQGAER